MKKLNINLENCYGINKLNHCIDFNGGNGYIIYAPNGTMKSSFAKTFEDISKGKESKELIFDKTPLREVYDEEGMELRKDNVFVINTFNDSFNFNKVSKLLVNQELKKEYDELLKQIKKLKDNLIREIKPIVKSNKCKTNADIERLFINDLSKYGDNFLDIVLHFKDMSEYTFDVDIFKYNILFDNNNVKLIEDMESYGILRNYCKKFNELIEKSEILEKEFTPSNAIKLDGHLNEMGYFKAHHELILSNGTIIKNEKELIKLINEEKNNILEKLKDDFDKIDENLENSENNFKKLIQKYQDTIIEEYLDIDKFKEKIWISILNKHEIIVNNLIEVYELNSDKLHEIAEKAIEEKSQWEKTIDIFNNRFHLPVMIKIDEKRENIIINNKEPVVDFYYGDLESNQKIEQKELMNVLSTGEQRALYILNIVYELELLKLSEKPTLLVVDDLADSFDYENKYAIIEYLNDMLNDNQFKLIILTHNFDFCRTISSRLNISRKNVVIAEKNNDEIILNEAHYINNAFTAWKKKLKNGNYNNSEFIASIPFLRNIIEYTNDSDINYDILTSVLHFKDDTPNLTVNDIYLIYDNLLKISLDKNKNEPLLEFIYCEADKISENDSSYIKLEEKLTLAIATRLIAEKFMINNIQDNSPINSNQTRELFNKFENEHPDYEKLNVLETVLLITPEYIHVNSFMYEPLIDLPSIKLKKLYNDVKGLSQ